MHGFKYTSLVLNLNHYVNKSSQSYNVEQVYVRKEILGLWTATQDITEEWSCAKGSSGLAFVTAGGPTMKQQ